MGGTDGFDDGESEPGSAAGAGAGLVGAIEAFEHVRQSVSRNAEAVVRDFENRAIPLAANTDLDHASYWCVFDGVIDEVHDYLLQANLVPYDMNSTLCMDAQPDRLFLRQEFHFACRRGRQFSEIQMRLIHLHFAGVEARDRQQTFDDPGHPVSFFQRAPDLISQSRVP